LFLDASSTAPSSRLCAASNAAWHLAVNVVVSSFFEILFLWFKQQEEHKQEQEQEREMEGGEFGERHGVYSNYY
jgi:hypothetical protein